MLLPKRAVCDSKELKFFKKQQGSRLFSTSGIKTPLSRITLVGPLLF